MENYLRNTQEKDASAGAAQAALDSSQEDFDFSEIEVEEVSFEASAKALARRIFAEALRELGYYGASHDLAGVHFHLRDRNSQNTVEIGWNSDNGEFLLRLVTERHREPRQQFAQVRFSGGTNG